MSHYLNKAQRWLDDIDKGKELIMALQFPAAYDRITYMLELYPELIGWTHVALAALLGLQRETVTRALNKFPEYRQRRLTKCR